MFWGLPFINRVISKLKSILSFRDLETIIHAFVSSRIDYCNSVYIGITQGQLSRLQLVQNAAARFLTRTKKRERITPVLVSLHWLPVEFRIEFKVLLMVFKALHGISPKYIAELLIPYQNSRNLRSSNQMILHVPKILNILHLWMLLSLDWNRTFLVELLESIRGIGRYNLMLNLLNFVCVTVCNDAGKHSGQWQLF